MPGRTRATHPPTIDELSKLLRIVGWSTEPADERHAALLYRVGRRVADLPYAQWAHQRTFDTEHARLLARLARAARAHGTPAQTERRALRRLRSGRRTVRRPADRAFLFVAEMGRKSPAARYSIAAAFVELIYREADDRLGPRLTRQQSCSEAFAFVDQRPPPSSTGPEFETWVRKLQPHALRLGVLRANRARRLLDNEANADTSQDYRGETAAWAHLHGPASSKPQHPTGRDEVRTRSKALLRGSHRGYRPSAIGELAHLLGIVDQETGDVDRGVWDSFECAMARETLQALAAQIARSDRQGAMRDARYLAALSASLEQLDEITYSEFARVLASVGGPGTKQGVADWLERLRPYVRRLHSVRALR